MIRPERGDFVYAASLLRDLRGDPRLGPDEIDSLSASIDRVAAWLQEQGAK